MDLLLRIYFYGFFQNKNFFNYPFVPRKKKTCLTITNQMHATSSSSSSTQLNKGLHFTLLCFVYFSIKSTLIITYLEWQAALEDLNKKLFNSQHRRNVYKNHITSDLVQFPTQQSQGRSQSLHWCQKLDNARCSSFVRYIFSLSKRQLIV